MAALFQQEDWFLHLLEFREDPENYLATHTVDEESYTLDVLQVLCKDNVPDVVKVHLLGLLEEFVDTLMPTVASAEQVIVSLMDMFRQAVSTIPSSQTNQAATNFKTSLLTTITSILISRDFCTQKVTVFQHVVELLLDIVCQSNHPTDRHVRSVACQCTEQIETLYPGAFVKKLEYIYQLCQREYTPIAQQYMSLFTRTLGNAIVAANWTSTTKTHLNEVLCNRTEALKPYIIPKTCMDLGHFLTEKKKHGDIDVKSLDMEQVKKSLGFLVEHVNLWSIPTVAHIMSVMIDIVASTPDIPPSIFKGLMLRFLSSNDLSSLHIVLKLKATFGEKLFRDEDVWKLLNNVITSFNLRTESVGHRLLMFQWALSFPSGSAGFPDQNTCPLLADEDDYAELFPRVFDGPDTQLKKMMLLSAALRHTPSESVGEASSLLIRCLGHPHKLASHGMGGKTLALLLKALYCFNVVNTNAVIQNQTTSLLVDLVMKYPQFSGQALRFVEALERCNHNAKHLSEDLLCGLVRNIQPAEGDVGSSQLLHHLHTLQEAAKSLHISPKDVLEKLRMLLEDGKACREGDWIVGCSAVSVCRHILQAHSTRSVTGELGDQLHLLSTEFSNVDVQDRARFYYALFTSLSSEKVSAMLTETSPVKVKDEEELVSLTRSAGLSGLMPVVKLQTPVLKLVRSQTQDLTRAPSHPSYSGSVEDYLHRVHGPTASTKFTMLHCLQFVDGGDNFDELFSIVLKFGTDPDYSVISDVQIPYLHRWNGQNPCNHQVDVVIEAKNPVPTALQVQAVFTGPDGRTYVCAVGTVQVSFQDLALPLPVSRPTKSALFSDLWSAFTSHDEAGCVQSVEFLRLSPDRLNELKATNWGPLLIESSTGETEIGMFLPPSWHLLLRVESREEGAVVSLATDNTKLLALVSEHLHSLQDS